MQATSQLLDIHLSQFIKRYKKDNDMRGLQRLATVTQTIINDMDAEAGAVADEFVAAQARSKEVVSRFRQYVGEVKASTAQVEAIINQLTNSPPLPESGS